MPKALYDTYSVLKLKNGAKLLYHKSPSPITHFAIVLNVGSRDETKAQWGLSHLIEHCAFKGSKHYSLQNIIDKTEGLGHELNAYTTKEDTTFYASFLSDQFKSQANILLDIVFNPSFPENELRREKKVVREEIRDYLDNTTEQLFDDFDARMFKSQSLGRSILGKEKQLLDFSSSDLKAFVNTHFYTFSNVVFAISSDHPPKKIKQLLEKKLKTLDFTKKKRQRKKSKHAKTFSVLKNKKDYQSHLLMGTKAPSYKSKGYVAVSLLNYFFGANNMASRLNFLLREKHGLCYTAESNYVSYSDTGQFIIYVGCSRKNLKKAEDIIASELTLLSRGISDKTLKKLKHAFITQWQLSLEHRQTNLLANAKTLLVSNKLHSPVEIISKIEKLTPKDVNRWCSKLFDLSRYSKLIYKSNA